GASQGFLTTGVDNGFSQHVITIDADELEAGFNTITFVQTGLTSHLWGVTDLTLRERLPEPAPHLEIGVADPTSYGNGINGQTDHDGRLDATFVSNGSDLSLSFSAFDIDNAQEIEVYLNGTLLGTLEPGVDNGTSVYKILLPGDMQISGTNTVSFVQTGLTSYIWGISGLRLDEALPRVEPTDDRYDEQWYLGRIGDMETLWADYTGNGITVGVYDDGLQWLHPDLVANYDASRHIWFGGQELDPSTGGSAHGTAVAGIIAADDNGTGTVGVAFDATLTGVNMIDGVAGAGNTDLSGFEAAMMGMTQFDIVNHSWGATPGFDTSTEATNFFATALPTFEDAIVNGRDGLGTVLVKSAGNAASNSQGDLLDASRFSITVGAVTENGGIASYSNHGANLLIAAPSSGDPFTELGILTTDLTGAEGFGPDDYTGTDSLTGFGGTSAAAPIVSGVAALMLEANPDLGWRDIKNILAYSAKITENEAASVDLSWLTGVSSLVESVDWSFNGGDNWNGGGLHFAEDFGYGMIDAYAAVRMAEAWHLFGTAQTSANEVSYTLESAQNVTIGSGTTLTFDSGVTSMNLETVEVTLSLTSTSLDVWLVSGSGTRVQLLDSLDTVDGPLTWSFSAEAFRGENAADGIWSLEFNNLDGGSARLTDYEIIWFGSAASADSTYHYTDEIFAALGTDAVTGAQITLAQDATRQVLTDSDGGTDWLNLSAMTGYLEIDLRQGAVSSSSGAEFLTIAAGTVIENVVAGDGADYIIGNDVANELHGMRGNDTLDGGLGDDLLVGGAGTDTFVFAEGSGTDTVLDYCVSGGELDMLYFVGFDPASVNFTDDGSGNAVADLGGGDMLILSDVDAGLIDDTYFYFDLFA
ncbi:S8 family serine peptidase, partial [Ruegeria arenilitoris]|uniref:S8 family serine peptidase n=1 Tax=Ruegeria arenilitoris TaxID=1173585 RepID=UPI00147F4FDF